ncbi:conjugal transfer protein TraG N-terminal domain-containing protein [bacterium]|nr:conjugal transfer protein TraG N-terminal domain-containing protein [bacterium]
MIKLGAFPVDSVLMFLGLSICGKVLSMLKVAYITVVAISLVVIVWRSVMNGEGPWSSSVINYLLVIILFSILVSHKMVISINNIQPRSGRESADKVFEKFKGLKSDMGSVRVPVVFFKIVQSIDELTNAIAYMISGGDYHAVFLDFVTLQAEVSALSMGENARGNYLRFVADCTSKAITTCENEGVIVTGPKNFIGNEAYIKMYEKHVKGKGTEWTTTVNGVPMYCNEAYDKLGKLLKQDAKRQFTALERMGSLLKKIWYKIPGIGGGWTFAMGRRARGVGLEDQVLEDIVRNFERKASGDPASSAQIVRNISPTGSFFADAAGAKALGRIGQLLTIPAFLGMCSTVVRVLPYLQGACLLLLYAASPIIFLLALLPGRLGAMLKFFTTVLWVHSWTICWAIAGLVGTFAGGLITMVSGKSSFWMNNLEMPTLTVLLVILTPYVSWVFINGTVTSMVRPEKIPTGNVAAAASSAAGKVG